MTKDEARKKIDEIIDERNDEADRIIAEAKANGTWPPGLDTANGFFVELDARTKKRMQEVIDMIDKD